MSKKKFSGNISGKGYYIALGLCAAAIGISGFLYYRNLDKNNQSLQNNDSTQGNYQNQQAVIATNPDGTPVKDSQTDQNPVKVPMKTVSPLEGQTVAVYAMDSLTYNATTRDWRTHNGIDIAAEAGTAVCAAADGEVYTVYEDEAMGMTVVIRHQGGYTTKYASLAEDVPVKTGDTVTMGQTIGSVGSTALMESAIGDHIHFSVSLDGKSVNPDDFLNQE